MVLDTSFFASRIRLPSLSHREQSVQGRERCLVFGTPGGLFRSNQIFQTRYRYDQ